MYTFYLSLAAITSSVFPERSLLADIFKSSFQERSEYREASSKYFYACLLELLSELTKDIKLTPKTWWGIDWQPAVGYRMRNMKLPVAEDFQGTLLLPCVFFLFFPFFIYPISSHLTSPHLTSPHLTSPHLTSPHLTSSHLMSSHRIT